MAIRSRTKTGWGFIGGQVGTPLAGPPFPPATLRLVIPGNDIKRVFSLSAGYIPFPADTGVGILLSGLLVICEGVLNEESILNPTNPFDITEINPDQAGLMGFANNRVLFACPVSGVTPFHGLFSDNRAIESNEADNITIMLSACPRSNTVANNIVACNGFLNAFGVVDVAGQKRDFSNAYEIR